MSTTLPEFDITSDVTSDGTAFDVAGDQHAPVMVLIHGLGLCRRLWDDHLPAFATRYRVVRYDLYGHGDSAPPPQAPSLVIYAGQLASLLDHLGVASAVIVGFSIGGMINRRFAMDYPDRAAALVILNSPHDRGSAAQAAVEARAAAVRDEGRMATMDAALERWFTPAFRSTAPTALQLVRDWRQAAEPESYAGATMVLAAGVTELVRPHPPISVPALVMTCADDTGSTPAMSREIAAEISGADLLIIDGYRHLGLVEDPAGFTAPILDFCERTDR